MVGVGGDVQPLADEGDDALVDVDVGDVTVGGGDDGAVLDEGGHGTLLVGVNGGRVARGGSACPSSRASAETWASSGRPSLFPGQAASCRLPREPASVRCPFFPRLLLLMTRSGATRSFALWIAWDPRPYSGALQVRRTFRKLDYHEALRGGLMISGITTVNRSTSTVFVVIALFLVVLGGLGLGGRTWYPEIASVHGPGMQRMLDFTLLASAGFFVLGHLALIYLLVRAVRHPGSGRRASAPPVAGRPGARRAHGPRGRGGRDRARAARLRAVLRCGAPADALQVDMTGRQFFWAAHYRAPTGWRGPPGRSSSRPRTRSAWTRPCRAAPTIASCSTSSRSPSAGPPG